MSEEDHVGYESGSISDDGPGFDTLQTGTPIIQRYFEPVESDDFSIALVEAIAEAMSVPPTELLKPLYDFVDIPAVESLFFNDSPPGTSRIVEGSIQFRYGELLVTVESDGWILVSRADDSGPLT